MDETADASGRSILNILVGECSEVPINPPSLLKTTELSKTNSETIVLEIMNTLSMLFKNDTTKYKNLKLLLTDAAPYALKVGRILKEMIPGLMHVTCICHALHNLCESIRDANSVVNDCIALLKKLLVKNKTNKDLYYEKTSLRMPKFPVLTRWGTWIDCVVFLYENFARIVDFVKSLPNDNLLKGPLDAILESDHLEFEIRDVYAHRFLTHAIKSLEESGLSTEKQIEILLGVQSQLLVKGKYSTRFNSILSRNPNIQFFIEFNSLRSLKKNKIFAFAPLTTVDVERSFSLYKYILDDRRRNLSVCSMEKLIFLYFNKNQYFFT